MKYVKIVQHPDSRKLTLCKKIERSLGIIIIGYKDFSFQGIGILFMMLIYPCKKKMKYTVTTFHFSILNYVKNEIYCNIPFQLHE